MKRHLWHAAALCPVLAILSISGLNCPVLAATAASVRYVELIAGPQDGDDQDQAPGTRRAEPNERDGPASGEDGDSERGRDRDFVPEFPPGCLFRQGPLELLV